MKREKYSYSNENLIYAQDTKKKSVIRSKKIALSSVLIALAMIFSYIEAIIPFNFGIPGIKLGLSNLVVIIALYGIGTSYAFSINVIRIVLSGVLFSGVFGIMYSMAGGLLSFLIMVMLKQTNKFSVVGISMAGGMFHNVGQIIVAALIIENIKIMFYLPVLLISGMITGIIIGIIGYKILRLITGKTDDFEI